MADVWALGINHHSAPLDLRARFAIAVDQLQPMLQQLKQSVAPQHGLSAEVALLSTCNRTEIYGNGSVESMRQATQWLVGSAGVEARALQEHVFSLQGRAASEHTFRVACGLESMVLGEPQILGQMKEAVRAADHAGLLGATLHQLFQRSFFVAKEVRTQTALGSSSISMAAACVRLATQVFERLQDCHILFVGAGEMIQLAATHFIAQQPAGVVVVNRNVERSVGLAQQFHGQMNVQTAPLSSLPDILYRFDVVISCTASTLPLIGLGAVERALAQRKRRPMLMVDLAVPRDIEAEVGHLEDVFLYTVDDISQVVQLGREQRQAAVAQAEAIVASGVIAFEQWREQRENVSLLQSLHAQSLAWQQREISKAMRQLSKGEDPQQVLQGLAHALSQKMLHGTLRKLRSTEAAERAFASRAVEQLFLASSQRPLKTSPSS